MTRLEKLERLTAHRQRSVQANRKGLLAWAEAGPGDLGDELYRDTMYTAAIAYHRAVKLYRETAKQLVHETLMMARYSGSKPEEAEGSGNE